VLSPQATTAAASANEIYANLSVLAQAEPGVYQQTDAAATRIFRMKRASVRHQAQSGRQYDLANAQSSTIYDVAAPQAVGAVGLYDMPGLRTQPADYELAQPMPSEHLYEQPVVAAQGDYDLASPHV
jgi:hypothetical protein